MTVKLTDKQRNVLENGASGICIRGEWTWLLNGEPVTRQVNALKKRGLMQGIYYHGGRASISATDAGRAALCRAEGR